MSTAPVPTVTLLAASLPLNSQNGLRFDAEGRLLVSTSAPIASFTNGLPFDADQALCIVLTDAPPLAAVAATGPIASDYEMDLYDE